MFAIRREDVLDLLKQRGPIVPTDLRKNLQADTFLIGAVLSELSSRGLVKVTSIKKGGSPFYYLPGQEEFLESLTVYLHEKDQNTVDWLKGNGVARDDELEMFKRVSLRKVKDYAKPLKARTKEGQEILFWRYYRVQEQDAVQILRDQQAKIRNDAVDAENKNFANITSTNENVEKSKQVQDKVENNTNPEIKIVPSERENIKETSSVASENIKIEVNDTDSSINNQSSTNSSVKELSDENVHKETQMRFVSNDDATVQKVADISNREKAMDASLNVGLNVFEPEFDKTEFYEKLVEYFVSKSIKVVEQEEIGKAKEYKFLLKVPSAVGEILMSCRGKDKKKLNETDIAGALLEAKMLDVSCLFLTNGVFTKKAQKLIDTQYTGLVVKNMNE